MKDRADCSATGLASLVALDGVSVRFGATTALDDVTLTVDAGERVALVGPSGAGKSTLLAVCRGAVAPSSGGIRIRGVDLADLSGPALRATRATIGTVHQQLHLAGRLQVVHNVNAGRLGSWSRRRALWSLLRPQQIDEAVAALEHVGIADKLNERTDRLSGGQQQRVALARVLIQDPRLVLADEPIASLDPTRGREVMELLGRVAVQDGRALLVSLHAFEAARRHCDRIVGLRDGRVAFDTPAADVTDEMATALYRIQR